jgi:hypothetical protein
MIMNRVELVSLGVPMGFHAAFINQALQVFSAEMRGNFRLQRPWKFRPTAGMQPTCGELEVPSLLWAFLSEFSDLSG